MKTKIWGHRGASGYAPENTIESFLLARDMGADGIELDVQLSKDGEIVVIHDETIDRVSDGQGYVKDYTLQELKDFNVNQTIHSYGVCRIPTLREVFDILKDSAMEINIELKTGIFFYERMEEKVYSLVKEYGMEDRIWYSSFNHYSITKIKELNPDAKTGFLFGDIPIHLLQYTKSQGIEAVHPGTFHLQIPNLIEESHKLGLGVHIWTVNDETLMKELCEKQTEAIITNYPDKAIKVRQSGLY